MMSLPAVPVRTSAPALPSTVPLSAAVLASWVLPSAAATSWKSAAEYWPINVICAVWVPSLTTSEPAVPAALAV